MVNRVTGQQINSIVGYVWMAIVRHLALMLKSPQERTRSVLTQRRLISTLFGRASNILMVAVAAVICGATAWIRGGCWVSGLVATIEVILLLARCLIILTYQKRERAGLLSDPDPWLCAFWAACHCFLAVLGHTMLCRACHFA